MPGQAPATAREDLGLLYDAFHEWLTELVAAAGCAVRRNGHYGDAVNTFEVHRPAPANLKCLMVYCHPDYIAVYDVVDGHLHFGDTPHRYRGWCDPAMVDGVRQDIMGQLHSL